MANPMPNLSGPNSRALPRNASARGKEKNVGPNSGDLLRDACPRDLYPRMGRPRISERLSRARRTLSATVTLSPRNRLDLLDVCVLPRTHHTH